MGEGVVRSRFGHFPSFLEVCVVVFVTHVLSPIFYGGGRKSEKVCGPPASSPAQPQLACPPTTQLLNPDQPMTTDNTMLRCGGPCQHRQRSESQ